jgi:hypothetical protein
VNDGEVCAEIELRLVDGQRPADDPALAAHVRSCLRCFRAAAELREVPHIAALLRDIDEPDPGDLFWARFPRTVADAWEQRAAALPRTTVWRRAAGWFQRPIPAALSGAAVAAALVLVLVGHRGPAPASSQPPATKTVAARSTEGLDDEPAPGLLGGDDDPLEALELADAQLVTKLGGAAVPAGDDGAELEPSPVEEVELLEGDDLRAVAQALHGRSQI